MGSNRATNVLAIWGTFMTYRSVSLHGTLWGVCCMPVPGDTNSPDGLALHPTLKGGVEFAQEYFSKYLAIRIWWQKGSCFLRWKVVDVYFFVQSEALTDDYSCEGASCPSLCLLCLLNVQAALFKEWYAYQQTFVACRHIHQNPHIHRCIVSTFSPKVLVYRKIRLLKKNLLL